MASPSLRRRCGRYDQFEHPATPKRAHGGASRRVFQLACGPGPEGHTAITVANMSRQMGINLLNPNTDPNLQIAALGWAITDSGKSMFTDAIVSAQSTRVVRIDIGTEWWSTRLFLHAVPYAATD